MEVMAFRPPEKQEKQVPEKHVHTLPSLARARRRSSMGGQPVPGLA
jgi:hypothetical protein